MSKRGASNGRSRRSAERIVTVRSSSIVEANLSNLGAGLGSGVGLSLRPAIIGDPEMDTLSTVFSRYRYNWLTANFTRPTVAGVVDTGNSTLLKYVPETLATLPGTDWTELGGGDNVAATLPGQTTVGRLHLDAFILRAGGLPWLQTEVSTENLGSPGNLLILSSNDASNVLVIHFQYEIEFTGLTDPSLIPLTGDPRAIMKLCRTLNPRDKMQTDDKKSPPQTDGGGGWFGLALGGAKEKARRA